MEDDVIKRKLLIDGDGVGDDRRINVLLKSFLKWSSNVVKEANQTTNEDQNINLQRLVGLVNGCRHAMKRSELSSNIANAEIEYYARLQQEIAAHITHTHSDIIRLKSDLIEAEKQRKRKIEYNELCDHIEQEPARKDTLASIHQLDADIKELENVRKKLVWLGEERKKTFKLLQESVFRLQQEVNDVNPHEYGDERKELVHSMDREDDDADEEDDPEDDYDDQLPTDPPSETVDEEPVLSKDTYPELNNQHTLQ